MLTTSRPRRRVNLSVRTIDGETVVLDRDGGFVHQLNDSATYVWKHCDGSASERDLAHRCGDQPCRPVCAVRARRR